MNFFKKLVLGVSIFMISSVSVLASPIHPMQTNNTNSMISSTINLADMELGEIIVLEDGAVLTPISQEEYIQRLAKEKGISIQEATSIEKNSAKNTTRVSYYYDYEKKFTYEENSQFKAQLEATIKIYSQGGDYRQIDEVLGVSSRGISGTSGYEWIETSAYSDPEGGDFPTWKVTLGAKGYFKIVNEVSLGGSVEIIPGFSVESSGSSSIIYTSETMNMRDTYSLY